MVDDGYSGQRSFAYLDDLENYFRSTYGQKCQTALALSLNADMNTVFKRLHDSYNKNDGNNTLNEVKQKVTQVREVMIDNVDRLINRGEKIEMLVDKSDELLEESISFSHKSTAIRRQFCWQNIKAQFLIVLFVLVIIYGITAIACGGADFRPKCLH
jgi:vesicle-associated membrane protein 7